MADSRLCWVFVAAAASLISACSDDAEEPGGTATADAFIQEATQAYCSRAASCCVENGDAVDENVCASYMAARFDEVRSYPFRADAASKCLEEMRAANETCAIFALDSRSCATVFRGSKPLGASCERNEDCAQADGEVTTCTWSDVEPSRCVRTVEVGLDEDCTSSPDESHTAYACSAGLYCAYPKCAKPAAIGESCNGVACVPEAYCDYDSLTCIAMRQQGEACYQDSECASWHCADTVCGTPAYSYMPLCSSIFVVQ